MVKIPLDAIGFGVGNRLEVLSLYGDVIANPDLASPDDLPEITAPMQKLARANQVFDLVAGFTVKGQTDLCTTYFNHRAGGQGMEIDGYINEDIFL